MFQGMNSVIVSGICIECKLHNGGRLQLRSKKDFPLFFQGLQFMFNVTRRRTIKTAVIQS